MTCIIDAAQDADNPPIIILKHNIVIPAVFITGYSNLYVPMIFGCVLTKNYFSIFIK